MLRPLVVPVQESRAQQRHQVFCKILAGFVAAVWLKAGIGIQFRINVAQSRQDGRFTFTLGKFIHQGHEHLD